MRLLNEFATHGSSLEDFCKESELMDETTAILDVKGADIMFLSLCDLPEYQVEGKATFFVFNETYLDEFLSKGSKFRVGTIPIEYIGQELLDELKQTTGLMAIIDHEYYIISEIAMPTITFQASVGGNLTLTRNNLIRNLHLADAIISKNEKLRIVYRKEIIGKDSIGVPITAKKIFACLGKYFYYTPASVLTEIVKDCSTKMKVRSWDIDHILTNVHMENEPIAGLPDKVYPGIIFSTSDVGRSSFTASGVFRYGNSITVTDVFSSNHKKKISKDEIMTAISHIMEDMISFEETLRKLQKYPLLDYERVDVSSDSGSAVNYQAITDIVSGMLNKFVKPVSSMARVNYLLNCIKDEVISTKEYTYYDIALILMTCDRIKQMDRFDAMKLRQALAKIPEYLLQDREKKSLQERKAETDKVMLLPA